MRYFEIARPTTDTISAATDTRDAAGELGSAKRPRRLGCANSWNPSDRRCNFVGAQDLLNRRSRRQHLSPRRSQ